MPLSGDPFCWSLLPLGWSWVFSFGSPVTWCQVHTVGAFLYLTAEGTRPFPADASTLTSPSSVVLMLAPEVHAATSHMQAAGLP